MAIRESRALQAQSDAHVGLGLTLRRRAQMNATFQAGLSPAQAIALLVLEKQSDDTPKAPAWPIPEEQQGPSTPTGT